MPKQSKEKKKKKIFYTRDSSEDEDMIIDSETEKINDNSEQNLDPEKTELDQLNLSTQLLLDFEKNRNPIIENKHIFGYDIYPQSARDLTTNNSEIILTMEKDAYNKTSFDYAIQKNWMWAFELAPSELVHRAVLYLFMNNDIHQMIEKIMYEYPQFQSPSFVKTALNQKEYDFKRLPRETKDYIKKNAYKFIDKERFQKLVKSMIDHEINPEINAQMYNVLDFKECCPDFLHPESYFIFTHYQY